MTNYSTKNKALKAAMVGAVAFTPVLAVGVNADKASAVENIIPNNVKTFLDQLDVVYADERLSDTDLKLLHDAQNYLAGKGDAFWEASAEKMVGNRALTLSEQEVLKYLTPLFAASTTTDLKSAINDFYKNVDNTEFQAAFGVTGSTTVTMDTFTSFLVEVEAEVFTNFVTSNDGSSLFNVFANTLINSTNYPAVKKAITDKFVLTNVFNELQDILNVKVIHDAKPAFAEVAAIYDEKYGVNTGGGSVGGGTPAPGPIDSSNGEVTTTGSAIESNPQSVIDAINSATTVKELVIELAAGTETVSIPATILTALEKKNNKAVVVIVAGDATYEIPVGQIDLANAAKDLGVASVELKLVVILDEIANPLAGKAKFKTLSDAIDFKLSIVAPGGKSVELKYFNKPVKRSIVTSAALNPLTTVGVVVNANGTVVAVPTFVPTTAKSAVLYRNSNSVYTLIENSKTFKDVDKGASWAEEYVEKLASRMVVNGVNEDSFKPSQMINRGEFAAILARGLGLVAEDMAAKDFKDVSLSQGFNKNGEIAAVVDAGLVKGFEDGTFRPYDEITRDQAAIMISRAIDYINSDLVKLDSAKKLSNFKDLKEIGAASRSHVEKVYQAGYLEGFTDDTFRPSAEANRAQMAKILYNFLESIEYIN
ncbi:MAG: S-layer homology domain-containing protein [Firmicutes bacterium]|nr:S-layer homology domain-containing protein [Bacillota bacterium]